MFLIFQIRAMQARADMHFVHPILILFLINTIVIHGIPPLLVPT
jgi:hypothetical protein